MSSKTSFDELAAADSISPGDRLEAIVTIEDGTVCSTVRGRRVTYPDVTASTLESNGSNLEVEGDVGLRFVVRQPIYSLSDELDSVFVEEVVETFESDERRAETGGVEERKTNERTRDESAPNQNLGRSRNHSVFGTDPEMMRGLVQGKL